MTVPSKPGDPVQNGAVGAGAAEIDLRYLGSRRTLVLVDGQLRPLGDRVVIQPRAGADAAEAEAPDAVEPAPVEPLEEHRVARDVAGRGGRKERDQLRARASQPPPHTQCATGA